MTHTDDELQFVSKYFTYHVKMYTETFLWINNHKEKPEGWDTYRNAIIEDNLIHARILIDFFFSSAKYPGDIVVNDYFDNTSLKFPIAENIFLKEQSRIIGGQLVHLTNKAMPELKSEQVWPIFELKENLTPLLLGFLASVPDNKFDQHSKAECNSNLLHLKPNSSFITINAST